MKAKASEVIRATALKLIVDYPNGLSLAELRNLTENQLRDIIQPDNGNKSGKFRSSLWDLEKRFPDYIKKDNSGKSARFVPTPQLLADKTKIVVPEYVPTAKELLDKSDSRYGNNPYLDIVGFKAKVCEVIALIEQIDMNGIDLRYSRDFKEIKAITKALIHLEGLKDLKYNIQHVHTENLER